MMRDRVGFFGREFLMVAAAFAVVIVITVVSHSPREEGRGMEGDAPGKGMSFSNIAALRKKIARLAMEEAPSGVPPKGLKTFHEYLEWKLQEPLEELSLGDVLFLAGRGLSKEMGGYPMSVVNEDEETSDLARQLARGFRSQGVPIWDADPLDEVIQMEAWSRAAFHEWVRSQGATP